MGKKSECDCGNNKFCMGDTQSAHLLDLRWWVMSTETRRPLPSDHNKSFDFDNGIFARFKSEERKRIVLFWHGNYYFLRKICYG